MKRLRFVIALPISDGKAIYVRSIRSNYLFGPKDHEVSFTCNETRALHFKSRILAESFRQEVLEHGQVIPTI